MNAAVSLDFDRRPSAVPYMVRGMLPVNRRPDLAPEIEAHWQGHPVSPAELADFRRITGLETGGAGLPLLYPHTFGFRLAMAILTHPRFPVPIWGVLQTRNHIVQHRLIPAAEPLDVHATVLHGRVVPKGAEFGRFTGDCNGIHMWDWYARRFGFRRALYHPPRVLGECLARLPRPASTDRPEAPLRLDAWLKGAVPHGAKVRLHAAVNGAWSTFALFAADERPSIVARLVTGESH
jgi:hypothetical protein